MAQFLKEQVAARITAAALHVFAAQGYQAASMAVIAREAGLSTGNLYRYFDNKEVLFEHVAPRALQGRLLTLLETRVRETGRPGFQEAARALMEFSLDHRLELVIMLSRGEGTVHEGFADKVRARLEALALAHFGVTRPSPALAFTLREVYAHFVATMVRALAEHEDPRVAAETYAVFHGAGLRALFAGGHDVAR